MNPGSIPLPLRAASAWRGLRTDLAVGLGILGGAVVSTVFAVSGVGAAWAGWVAVCCLLALAQLVITRRHRFGRRELVITGDRLVVSDPLQLGGQLFVPWAAVDRVEAAGPRVRIGVRRPQLVQAKRSGRSEVVGWWEEAAGAPPHEIVLDFAQPDQAVDVLQRWQASYTLDSNGEVVPSSR